MLPSARGLRTLRPFPLSSTSTQARTLYSDPSSRSFGASAATTAANASTFVSQSNGALRQQRLRALANSKVEYARAINLSAGCAALPLDVLQVAAEGFVDTDDSGMSVSEMGYRTKNFHDIMESAEEKTRELLKIPDTHEVHFFNGGATLQFAAIPMNLFGGATKSCNYVMNGHWSEKARNEALLFTKDVTEVCHDPTGLYFSLPEADVWKTQIDESASFLHYTAADTRQGFEFHEFPYEVVPEGQALCCDASANLGSKPVDVSKYGVLYAAAHKNFSTSGACYTIIRKDLITEDVLPGTPTMCNWHKFQTAPNKIYNVPVIFSIWLGKLTMEWMLRQGGLPFFEQLAIKRANTLYDFIDHDSKGFYRTFVTDPKFRSRMNVVLTIGDGESERDQELIGKFFHEAEQELGWLDIRAHPLGIKTDAIRVTTYNPQTLETVQAVRDFLWDFQKKHQ